MSLPPEPDADLSPLGALALLWPAVPEGLVGRAERERIEAAAARLAPIARVALELRLGEGRDEVDLHQFVSAGAADPAVLERFLRRSDPAATGEAPVRRFLGAWARDSGGLRADLDGIFLEWDRPDAVSGAPPAIFLPVQDRHDRGADGDARRRRIVRHIERLGLAGDSVAELLVAVPSELSISYIGFMLGRGDAVRINLRSIRPEDLAGVLARLGWPGDAGRAAGLFRGLVGLAGRVAVALDFAPALQPTIGFEAALPDLPAEEPRWARLFDRLCADGLCTEEKRAALERLGARLYPEEAGQEWPASWIPPALAAPRPFVPWFERRVSHVKLSIGADGEAGAKAYVSAQHHWSRAASPSPGSAAARPRTAPGAAAERAAGFLLAERDQDDFWRDFRLPNGASDEWVTAFVGYALVTSGLPLPAGLESQTVGALLARQRPEGGWGYNGISPADADSTAWALKFLRAAGHSGPEVERAERFLGAHLLPGGGVSTYARSTRIVFEGTGGLDDSGWRGSHACVAANVAGLIGEPAAGFLRSSQRADGAWTAYWWRDDAFATALAAEALPAGEARTRAAAWAARRSASSASAFEQAWLIRTLRLGGPAERQRARAMASTLAAGQQRDGGWDSSAEMLFPDPAELRRRTGSPPVPDRARLFTSASALLALSGADA